MTQEKKNEIADRYRVIVEHGRWDNDSKCCHKKNEKRCKNPDKYMVAVGMSFRLSTVIGMCCEKHLSWLIDKAIINSRDTIRNTIKRMKEEEIKEAKKVLADRR